MQETTYESTQGDLEIGSVSQVTSCILAGDTKYNSYTCFDYTYTAGQSMIIKIEDSIGALPWDSTTIGATNSE